MASLNILTDIKNYQPQINPWVKDLKTSGNVTLDGSSNAIKGRTDGIVPSGCIGEVIANTIDPDFGLVISGTPTYVNIISPLTLSPGIWDVTFFITTYLYTPNVSTPTKYSYDMGISTEEKGFSDGLAGINEMFVTGLQDPSDNVFNSFTLSNRYNLTSTTSLYLKYMDNNVETLLYGKITARRVA